MSEETLISVIIPVYGVEKYIERSAVSLFEQTIKDNIEFIFVDDCSPDNSITILKNVIERYPDRKQQVKILRHDSNKGLAQARQTGFDISKGKYIAHLDSDDRIEPRMYETLLDCAEKNGADIVACGYFEDYGEKREIISLMDNLTSEDVKDLNNSIPLLYYCAVWNKIIRRTLYSLNNIRWYPDINMYEDVGVTTRLRALSSKTLYLSAPLYYYNKENIQSITNNYSARKNAESVVCIEKLSEWAKRENIEISEFIKELKINAKVNILQNLYNSPDIEFEDIFPEISEKDIRNSKQSFSFLIPVHLTLKKLKLSFLSNLLFKIKGFLNH